MEENKELLSEEKATEEIQKVALHNRKLMLDNFKKGMLYLHSFIGVSKFKSVRRAIKRGHMSIFGDIYPDRPFNNRKSKESKVKRQIYGQLVKQRDI